MKFWKWPLMIVCWHRGYHLSPGLWGWLAWQGGWQELECHTCGRIVCKGRHKVRPGPMSIVDEDAETP